MSFADRPRCGRERWSPSASSGEQPGREREVSSHPYCATLSWWSAHLTSWGFLIAVANALSKEILRTRPGDDCQCCGTF